MIASRTHPLHQTAWVQLLLIAAAVWAGSYARVALSPLQEAMRLHGSFTDSQIGLLQGPAIALPIILCSVPIALLIDRLPRVRLLLLFVLTALLGTVLTALAPSFGWLFAGRSLVGLASTALLLTAFSLMADYFPPEQRGRGTMVIAGGAELSSPAAFALGGFILASQIPAQSHWQSALLWMTMPFLIIIALGVAALREPERMGVVEAQPPISAGFKELWGIRGVVLTLLAARCLVWLADGATVIWAAPMLSRRFEIGPVEIGAIMATTLLVVGLSAPVLGGLLADFCQKRGGPRLTIGALGLVAGISIAAGLFGIARDLSVTIIALAVFITCGFVINIAGAALATVVVPNEVRALYLSLSNGCGAIFGVALAPLAVSLLSEALGGPAQLGAALTLVCIISSACGVACLLFGRRFFPGATIAK
jgi:MFS family permease